MKRIPMSQVIKLLLHEEISHLPRPRDGVNGKDGLDGKDGRDGRDGETIIRTEFLPLPETLVYEDELEPIKEDLQRLENEFRMLVSKVLTSNVQRHGGGGVPKKVLDQIDKNTEEIENLSQELSSVIDELIAQGATTEEIMRQVVVSLEENKLQLKLLNAKTEAAFETTITEDDILTEGE